MKAMIKKDLMEYAKRLSKNKKPWHFHILSSTCILNEQKRGFKLMLEDEEAKEIFFVNCEKKPNEEGKELLQLLYGKDILEETKKAIEKNETSEEILRRVKDYTKEKIEWHHHMLFPQCIFNKRKGMWCILFEDPKNGECLQSYSEVEPREYLKNIESYFFSQKN